MRTKEQIVEDLDKSIRFDFKNLAWQISLIEEIDRLRIYFDYGANSLFAFLKSRGLPNATAQLRIDCARLMRDVPEIKELLESGRIHTTQLSTLSKAIRQKKRDSKIEVSVEEKRSLISKVKDLECAATEQLVALELDIPVIKNETKRIQKDGSTCYDGVSFSVEWMKTITRGKELLSHVNPNPSLAEMTYIWAKFFVQHKDPTLPRKPKRSSQSEVTAQKSDRITVEKTKTDPSDKITVEKARINPSDGITAEKARIIHQMYDGCQWPTKDGVCGSKYQSQVDHKISLWAGGTNDIENLHILCGPHNRQKYRLETNTRRK